jgi:mannose-1-phosphate guanylyltransferase
MTDGRFPPPGLPSEPAEPCRPRSEASPEPPEAWSESAAASPQSGEPRGQRGGAGSEAHPWSGATAPSVWAIILAGGAGTRLVPLTRRLTGESRPKQFCDLTGAGTLLEETVRRVARLVPPERQVVSLTAEHACYYEPLLGGCGGVQPVVQPANRGTALGVLYPALHVAARDPEATVAVFPSDHFVRPADRFMAAVADAASAAARWPDLTVLLGVLPSYSETEYGWIEPGEALDGLGGRVRRVRRFVEKPPLPLAREMLRARWLWNTLVLVSRVGALLRLAAAHLPDTTRALLLARATLGTAAEAEARRRVYAAVRPGNLSRDLLEHARGDLGVVDVRDVTWSDWGTPGRVVTTLARLGERPAWMTTELRKALARAGAEPVGPATPGRAGIPDGREAG